MMGNYNVSVLLFLLVLILARGLAIGNKYSLQQTPNGLTWEEGRQMCLIQGMDLAVINDDSTWQKVRRYLNTIKSGLDKDIWIGLIWNATQLGFLWVNYEPLWETHWATGEPNCMEPWGVTCSNNLRNDQNCVLLSVAEMLRWKTYTCNGKYDFLCKKLSSPNVDTTYQTTSSDTRYRQTSPDTRYRQTSPDTRYRQTSPDTRYRQTSPDTRYRQTSPDTRYRQTSPDTRYRQTSSDTRYRQTSPDTRYLQISPDTTYQQTSPDTTYLQTSQDTTYLQTYQDTTHLQTSQDTTYLQTSPDTTSLQTSPDITYLQTSPETTYLQTSPDTTYLQTSPDTRYLQTSQDTRYLQTSPEITYQQTSPDTTHLQTTPEAIHLQTSPSPALPQNSPSPIYLQASPGSTYVQTPQTTVYDASTIPTRTQMSTIEQSSIETCVSCKCNVTTSVYWDSINNTQRMYKVDKKKTSSYKRLHGCAEDNRLSAKVMGYVGYLVIWSVCLLIVAIDLSHFQTIAFCKRKGRQANSFDQV